MSWGGNALGGNARGGETGGGERPGGGSPRIACDAVDVFYPWAHTGKMPSNMNNVLLRVGLYGFNERRCTQNLERMGSIMPQ